MKIQPLGECWCSLVLILVSSLAMAQQAPRRASTIINNAIVWKTDNIKELLASGAFSSTDVGALESGMSAVPWGIKMSNKRLCEAEVLQVMPTRIELKVGETFPLQNLIFSSTAVGDYYFDKPVSRGWEFEAANARFDKKDMALHAMQPGESTFRAMSLCRAKGVLSKAATIDVTVVVTE